MFDLWITSRGPTPGKPTRPIGLNGTVTSASWTFRPARADDAPWMAELRAVVMRPDLERLGRFDPAWVRRRFLNAYVPADTRVITVSTEDVGLVALCAEPDARWIEHFYLHPRLQGQGIGGHVLDALLTESTGDTPFRLNVLQGSPARRLYERYGFVVSAEDDVDVWMTAPARKP